MFFTHCGRYTRKRQFTNNCYMNTLLHLLSCTMLKNIQAKLTVGLLYDT